MSPKRGRVDSRAWEGQPEAWRVASNCVTGDLSNRRALIDRASTRGKLMVIDARAPLEKMFGYSTAVRSLSQGRASYIMEPLEFAPAPESLLEALT